jgi:outer membrane protein
MKKILAIFVLAAGLVSGTAHAQTKVGYIRIDDVVGLMPELQPQKVNMDTIGQKYVTDSVLPRYNYIQSEYNRKVGILNDTIKNSLAVRNQILKELQDDQEELNNAQAVIERAMQYKQAEFLKPYYDKAKKAIETVAKEKGYTHVLSTDVFLVAPEADDMTIAVLTKLNIKLPDQKPTGTQTTNPQTQKPPVKSGN